MSILRTFETDEKIYSKLKEIAAREKKPIGDILNQLIEDFIKIHGDGNPVFKITQWVDNSKMKALPAFMRKTEEWQEYIENLQNIKEIEEILYQAQSITSFADKKLRYGSTQVIIK